MRREILFPLLGFLGGFVVAAMIFWQPAAQSNNASQPVTTDTSPARETAPVASADHSHRRLVVSARENEGVALVADSAPQPKGAAEIFHEAIGKLKDMDVNRRQAAIETLVRQLRAAGPEGFQVLRDYFRAGQDVKFQNGYAIVNGRAVQSLRAALLDSLGDWPGNEALDLTREILRTTSRMSEASIAIGQLEKKSPGVYRAEAIQALQQIATKPPEKDAWAMGGTALFDAMKQLKAPELLPAAETEVSKNPWTAPQFIASLDALPADVRAPALQRLFANEAVTKSMAANPWSMQALNYSEPVVAQNVAQLFTANTDKRFRENFLTNFANAQAVNFSGGSGFTMGGSVVDNSADRVARLQGRLAFLDTIAPQCATPVLQERLQDARDAIQKSIATPAADNLIRNGSGTLQISGTSAIIETGAVQVIQTQNPK